MVQVRKLPAGAVNSVSTACDHVVRGTACLAGWERQRLLPCDAQEKGKVMHLEAEERWITCLDNARNLCRTARSIPHVAPSYKPLTTSTHLYGQPRCGSSRTPWAARAAAVSSERLRRVTRRGKLTAR